MTLLSTADMLELAAISESAMEQGAITITDVVMIDDGAGSWTEQVTTRVVNGSFWTVGGDEAGEDQIKVLGRYRVEVSASVSVSATARIAYKGAAYAVKFPYPIGTFDPTRIIGLEDA